MHPPHDDPPSPQEPPLQYTPLPPPRTRTRKLSATNSRPSTQNTTSSKIEHTPSAQVTENPDSSSSASLTSLRSSVTVVEESSSIIPVTKDVNALPPSCSTSLTAPALRRSLDDSCHIDRSAPLTPQHSTLTLNSSCAMLRSENPFLTHAESSRNESDTSPISPAISAVFQRLDVAESGSQAFEESDRRSLISSFLDIYLQSHDSEQDETRSLRSSYRFPPSTEKNDVEVGSNLDSPGQRSTGNEVTPTLHPTSHVAPRYIRPQNLTLRIHTKSSNSDSLRVPKSAPAKLPRPLPPAPSTRNIRPLPQPPIPHAESAPASSIHTSFDSISSNSTTRRPPLPTPPINTRSSATHSSNTSLASTLTTSSSLADTSVTTPSDELHEPPIPSRRHLLPRLQISQHTPEILTPLPPDIPIPPSPMTAKRHQASKLRRFLGEDVPPELVFGGKKDLLVGDIKRLSARLRARTERPQAMYLEAESVYSDEDKNSINPESAIVEEEELEEEDEDLIFSSDGQEESEDSEDSVSDRDLDDFEEGHIDYARTNVINYQTASRVKRTSRLWVLEERGTRQGRDSASMMHALRRL